MPTCTYTVLLIRSLHPDQQHPLYVSSDGKQGLEHAFASQGAILQCKQLRRLCLSWEASSEYMLESEALGLIAEIFKELPELRALQWLSKTVANFGGDPDVSLGPKHYSSEFVRGVIQEHPRPGLVLLQTDNIQIQDLDIEPDQLQYLSAFNL